MQNCRTYRYYFGTTALDGKAMDSAARLFIGTHDFSIFSRTSERNPERTITSARVWREPGTCIFEVTGDSFLWNMVRLMAASLRRIGEGEEGEEAIFLRLEGERPSPLSPAPPDGLILWDVDCGISFLPLPVGGRRRTFLVRLGEHHAVLNGWSATWECSKSAPDQGHDIPDRAVPLSPLIPRFLTFSINIMIE